jgi:phenylacetate-CoA ligase
LEALRGLLQAVVPANPFQTRRLAGCELGDWSNLRSLEEASRILPITTKAELAADQEAEPPYGSNRTALFSEYTRYCQTSGTSGQPLVFLDTASSWEWLLGNWARIYEAAGVGRGDTIYFAFSFGPFLGFWTAFDAAQRAGCLCVPGGGLGSAARLRAMIRQKATVLLCTPTYALHLADVAEAEGIDLGACGVRKILVAGEPGGSLAEVRARLMAGWNGAQVFDHYGMTEVGPVTFEDLGEPGVQRVIPGRYWVEVVVPGGTASVEDGELGELVLTPLGRMDTPLIRYRTGDLVRARWDTKGCRLEGGILGRADDMVVVRGVNLYPGSVEAVVRSVPGIVEYRVHLGRRGSMREVELEVEAGGADAVQALERALEAAFSLRIPVRRVADGALPRFEMKARRWLKSGEAN